MSLSSRHVLIMLCAAALLPGVSASKEEVEGRDAAPSLRSLTKKKAPDASQLQVERSGPLENDPEKAAENYRKLLELAPDEDTKAEAKRRLADIQVQADDIKGNNDDGASLRQAIRLYEELLRDRPQDPDNDRVMYQLARARQNLGQTDKALELLQRLTKELPDSPLAGDAHFRQADLLYRLDRYAEAETEYGKVMDYKERTPFFEQAQYMRGWSQYRQSKFDAAIATFFEVLERELPATETIDQDKALAGIDKGKVDLVADSLRVVSLSFAALGGGTAVNEYFYKHGDTRFYPMIYAGLGKALLEKQRFNDSAEAYTAFTQRYPNHPLAPTFQTKVIETYATAGFRDLVVREKERYVVTYDPSAPYWKGGKPTEEVTAALRTHYEDLAKHNHAIAQQDKVKNRENFLIAARWYKRIIEVYPQDPRVAEMNFLLGDTLFDGGKTLDAAKEYTKTAYEYPGNPKSAEAAQAAFQAYERYAKEVPPADRPAALRQAVDVGLKMADTFNQHPARATVLAQVAQDLFEMKALDEAIAVAARVISAQPPATPEQRRAAWSVTGAAQFAQKRYPEAEKAYAEELKLTGGGAPQRTEVTEQLAASIYKQAEAARDSGDQKAAIDNFLRIAQITPDSKIRVNAEYDAASGLIGMEQWGKAAEVLEGFRTRYPGNALEADVDKKLALAYQKDKKPAQAAAVFGRIANRANETTEVRTEAAWLSAKLFDEAKQPDAAAKAYQDYVTKFPKPLDRSMEARRRLVEISRTRGDSAQLVVWLRDIIAADQNAGKERTEATRTLASQASLDIGRMDSAKAKQVKLTLPIEKSLPQKKAAVESAIASLNQAAGYGFAATTTAATYELGTLYQDFGKSIMDSERPGKLKDLELEQYNLLLEEQAYPFEEKAIAAHESNIKRVLQGRYD
jgi:tetratricopeptide (TPR) repeat protein